MNRAFAIVGRGCVLPGALDPAALWSRILGQDDLTGPSTEARWGLHPAAVCADSVEPSACARGGYVVGFDALWGGEDPEQSDQGLAAVPEGWNWLLVAARQALREASVGPDGGSRVGVILGSLGYPTRAFADIAARRWHGDVTADGVALAGQAGVLHRTLRACGLAGPALSLDAACASGLYALKTACDLLDRGDADVMLAAGLNAADDLFLHVGFTALGALSPTGRSAPLSALADGLLPAEGAAVVALKRLDDAVAAGDTIYAIVRGVGLSNDGRGRGLLAPTSAGQQRAMRSAYASSDLDPSTIDYLECHATGTVIGDREEIVSVRALFGDAHPLQLGSLKAQIGHSITASGTAALLKLCGAFEHATMPAAPRVSVEHPLEAIVGSALGLSRAATSWLPGGRPRRAAINAFGFGGCNAHAVLEGPEAASDLVAPRRPTAKSAVFSTCALALVACEIAVGGASDTSASLRVLIGLDPATRRIGNLDLAVAGVGFPPADLRQTLSQQLLLMRAGQAIRDHLAGIDGTRLGVYVGTDVDPASARHQFRWRLERIIGRPCHSAERDAVILPLQAAGVVGTMPNMPANRLNSLFDAGGPGLVVSDGLGSGRRALELAGAAIARGELDAALVGAVDASGGAFGDDPSRADATVLLLIVPTERAGGRDVLATFTPSIVKKTQGAPSLPWADAGAAHELLQLAVAAMCCRHALLPSDPTQPWIASDRVIQLHGFEVHSPRPQGLALEAPSLSSLPPADPGRDVGELAGVFTGAAAAYPGAGRQLLRAFPDIGAALHRMAPRLSASMPALLGQGTLSLFQQLQLSTLVSQAHAQLLEKLGLVPAACLGLSSGETNALVATGAWTDLDDLFNDISQCGMYEQHLAGRRETLRRAWRLDDETRPDWRCYRVMHPVAELRLCIADHPRVRLLVVHHAGDAVIGGEDHACRAVIAALGARAAAIEHDLVVHCPELDPFAGTWHRVHHRATRTFTTPRLYANAVNGAYMPSSDRCADLLTAQARTTVVFDATVKQAYEDGVRVFVELGPRATCTGWIDQILAGRPHVACSLDGTRGSLGDIAGALTALSAAGCRMDVEWWNAHMRGLRVLDTAPSQDIAAVVRIPGHLPQPVFDAKPMRLLAVPEAPTLAPVLPDRLLSVAPPASASVQSEPAPAQVPPAAIAALASCHEALLQVQQVALEQMAATATDHPPPPPLTFTRVQLEVHAGGRISTIFGAAFEAQDAHARQVRMPLPPLLLADRVVGMVGEPADMGTGTVWTETDVHSDAWYLHNARMPAGIVIEAGQADLFLISWLGVDLHNRGERVYRLLGCELIFHGRLPAVGETLRYEIAIDSHARHGEVGLFFFHSECRSNGELRLSVRQGQAGFFTDQELADSAGVLWRAEDDRPDTDAPLAAPCRSVVPSSTYSAEQVVAFAAGNALVAFGEAFTRCASHTRTPRIPAGRMQLFERVDTLEQDGGPWQRGYLRATLPITSSSWFFGGHFHNDPCMPGTLMLEGCLQTMAFYLAALGFVIDRDGWSFEPVPDRSYRLRCRGQVTPESRELVYEVFVAELHDGPEPTLVGDVLCTVDGLRAFHCRRLALKLTPDAPLGAYELEQIAPDREPVAEQAGFKYGQASLLACATGTPVAAFGPRYGSVPPTRRVPRLPAPPYHFISRVTALSDPPGAMREGAVVDTAYDIPPDAWYFAAHHARRMPACVLIEVALQPCGWLASYVGCAVQAPEEVFFRNLDGHGVLHRAVTPDDDRLRVRSQLKSISRAGGMTLVGFDVVCTAREEVIYELTTTFGFFPAAALEGQAGLAAEHTERALAEARSDADLLAGLDARTREYLAPPSLRMCDRVTHRELAAAGGAVLRGEKTIRPDAWFFRSHFFQDPVQPGSLGVEALVQLLQAHLLLDGAHAAIPGGVFADLVAPEATEWQFRGQVLPEATLVTLTLQADPIEKSPDRWSVRARGSLWVDGRRIYAVRGLTVSIQTPRSSGVTRSEVRFDPTTEPQWRDHRPTYAAPVLPGMAILSCAMAAAPDTIGVDDLVLRHWLVLDRPRTVALTLEGNRLRLSSDDQTIATGCLCRASVLPPAPEPVPPLPSSAPALKDPYASGAVFHGPAYHRVIEGRLNDRGVDVWLRVDTALDARERVPHILLDGGLHGVPHDALEQWFPELESGYLAYPSRIEHFRLFFDPPRVGRCEVRVRPAGFLDAERRFPRLLLHFLDQGRLWAELLLIEIRLPATRLGRLPGAARRAFMRDGVFLPGVRLSDEISGTSVLERRTLADLDWLRGTVETIYGLGSDEPLPRLQAIVAREHAAARVRLHPRDLRVDSDGRVRAAALPLLAFQLALGGDDTVATASDRDRPALAADSLEEWWADRSWASQVLEIRSLFFAACRRFVHGVRLVDPAAMARLHGQPLLLLANHQVAIESVLASMVLPPVIGRPLTIVAKQEHRETWIGSLAAGLNDDRHGPALVFVDRDRPQDMLERLAEVSGLAQSGLRSVMVHSEGTRALRGGQPVSTASGAWADLAIQAGMTVLPLRFCGGLPQLGVDGRLEFPFGFGAQELVLGRPIPAAALARVPLPARRARMLEGLAELEQYDLEPEPDATFTARVEAAQSRWALDEVHAVFLLLQADARAWRLDASDLPEDAMNARDAGDPFWAWFARRAMKV